VGLLAKPQSDRRADFLTVLAFAAILIAPSVDLFVRPDSERSVRVEQRNPAPEPVLEPTLASWLSYPERQQAWFNDTFGLRDRLLRLHNGLKIRVFGVSPSSRLVLGRNRWLFTTADRSIEGWRGLLPLSEKELETWRSSLESRRDWHAQHGIEFLFVIAPSKQEIYPEFLPPALNRVGPPRIDQLLESLRAHSDMQILDLRPALLAEKRNDGPDDFTFFPLGTHWTARGAMAGVRAMIERLSPRFPALHPIPPAGFSFKVKDGQGDSWANRLYLPDLLRQVERGVEFEGGVPAGWREEGDGRSPIRRVEQADQALPRAVVFHDSFGEGLFASLPIHFSSTLFVWQSDLDLARIEDERPDVVIQLLVDRTLMSPPPPPIGAAQDVAQRAREEFARSTRVLLSYDALRNRPPIEVRQDAVLIAAAQDGDPAPAGLGVDVASESGQILLPEFAFPSDANPVLRLEITSPEATILDLFYKTRSQATYGAKRRYSRNLEQGRNELYVELFDSELLGRLLVRPGRARGRYVIRALEVRAAPR
jgi:alginate O-acetyltransferase complex protein AlgJ